MSSAGAGAEPERARPGSGLWTLLAWLRRDGSSDSLSSAGSARTAASFAFLAPDPRPAALLRRPPSPPTDSYRKRLRDRNLRLHHDRDLTLRRKYGLDGYDAFSLPSARKGGDRRERDRRAASECPPRRAAHVPGKRRAPPPPARAATLAAPRRSRKRPAPQPPRRPLSEAILNTHIPERNEETHMSGKLPRDEPPPRNDPTGCKPEKYVKKEAKETKTRTEKSFLKQIFEGRKRNSAVETVPERILPSISELDKQAYEIIESCKLKACNGGNESGKGNITESQERSKGDMWFCTRCLRKYNDSVVTCVHCVTEHKKQLNKNDLDKHLASNHYTQTEIASVPSTSRKEAEEKQKLKDMLKEIKDSLPKRPKHEDKNNNPSNITTASKDLIVDAPTLPIGCRTNREEGKKELPQKKYFEINNVKTENKLIRNVESSSATERAIVSQPIVLQHSPSRDIIKLESFKVSNKDDKISLPKAKGMEQKVATGSSNSKEFSKPTSNKTTNNKWSAEETKSTSDNLNKPLKISSLLDSDNVPQANLARNVFFSQIVNYQQPEKIMSVQISNYKPVITLKSPAGNVLNSSQAAKSGQSVQKMKTTTTTQTSAINMASKQKQTGTKTNELSDNEKKVIKNNQSDTASQQNESQIVANSLAIGSNAPSRNTITSPLQKYANNKETKDKDIGNPNKNTKYAQQTDILQQPVGFNGSSKIEALDYRKPTTKFIPLDQHLKRRELINQLEQSIARGDEQAAAEAASKLAQLRLSCSVLSFSSQIVSAASTSNAVAEINHISSNAERTKNMPTTPAKLQNTEASTSRIVGEKDAVPARVQSKYYVKKTTPLANNDRQTLTEGPSTSTSNSGRTENDILSIEVWIEDKQAARGPIRMNMPQTSVMGDLRRHADTTLGLAANLQRWIVGRTLCTNDDTPLSALAGPRFDAPFYLCLVEPEKNKQSTLQLNQTPVANVKTESRNQTNNNTTDVYSELILLERRALVSNAEDFECGVCKETYKAGEGAVLRECVHTFCRDCLSDVVRHCEEPAVCCPAMGCPGTLQEREIRALVSPDEYERWLARGLAAAESGTRNAFHCRTRDCTGWALCEPGVTRFPCPVCKRTNCVSCQAIHEGETCEQYRTKQVSETNQGEDKTDEGTRAFLDTLISRGEALECPECSAIITKKWGCDWIKCSACKTEICWVTRGRRWGPAGRGDTSAGCRCGVDGKRCHPSCGYCH